MLQIADHRNRQTVHRAHLVTDGEHVEESLKKNFLSSSRSLFSLPLFLSPSLSSSRSLSLSPSLSLSFSLLSLSLSLSLSTSLFKERDDQWRRHERSQISFLQNEGTMMLKGLHEEIERLNHLLRGGLRLSRLRLRLRVRLRLRIRLRS